MSYMRSILLLLVVVVGSMPQRAYCQSDNPSQAHGMLHVVDSANPNATWSGFTASGQLVFSIGGKEQELAPDRIIAWQPESKSIEPRGEAVVLVDGSVLTGLIATLEDDSIRLQTSLFGLVSFSKSQVAAVVLDANSPKFAELYQQWGRDSTQGDDTIYLRDGQIDSGVIKTLGKSSMLRLSNTQSIEIDANSQTTQISVSRVAGIRFSPILFPINLEAAGVVYDFADGTHLVVKNGKLNEDQFHFETLAGVTLLASDRQACLNLCTGIFGRLLSDANWKLIAKNDLIEKRGQSPWTRDRWTYFETDRRSRRLNANEQMSLRVIPSVRMKLRNQGGWKRIVGALQVRPLAESEVVVSDVLGSRIQRNSNNSSDTSSLSIRFVAVEGGKLVDLWTAPATDNDGQQVPFAVDISRYSDFYLLIENPNVFSTPTEVAFDWIRFAK